MVGKLKKQKKKRINKVEKPINSYYKRFILVNLYGGIHNPK